MPQFINTNVASLNAQRNLNTTQGSMATALQRLSSGLRINGAKDDAAGLAVSQKMIAQVKSLNQAIRNANDGVSMIQTAEGGMQEIQTMMQRMRELAVQASSDTIGSDEREYIDTELQALMTEVNAISDRTKFNGQSLLTGTLRTTLGGATANDAVVGDLVSTTGGNSMITAIDVGSAVAGTTYTLTSASATTLTLTRASDSVAQTITASAAAANGTSVLNFTQLGVSITLQADSGGKTAAGIVTDMSAAANDTIVTTGSGSATFQVGADSGSGNSFSVSFNTVKIENGSSATEMDELYDALATYNTTTTRANAEALLSKIDNALDYVSSKRAELGSVQNRLGYTVANLSTTSENLSAAKSRITDADFASETAELTRSQILQQAGMAMLAQANALPNNVLALLRG